VFFHGLKIIKSRDCSTCKIELQENCVVFLKSEGNEG